jgi:hypothetical protein
MRGRRCARCRWSARSWWSAARWSASPGRARDRLSRRACRRFPWRRCLRPSAARQGGGAVHRQPGRAARGAGAHRRGRASEVTLEQGRLRDLLLAHHSRQREGGRRVINGLVGRASRSSPTAPIWCMSPAIRAAPRCEDMIAGCARIALIPVHGEALHLSEHAKLARAAGVPRSCCAATATWSARPGDPGIIDEVPAGRLYKDGAILISAEERTVAERRRLSFPASRSWRSPDRQGRAARDPEVELSAFRNSPPTSLDDEIAYDAVDRNVRVAAASRAGAIRRRSRSRSSARCAPHRRPLGQEADMPGAG